MHQFRPIDLCNTLYKTVTRLLVHRLKPFLPNLIHPFQSSFITGRKSSDNVILTQKVIHSMTISKSKQGLMALKIDLEKAFDRLEWNFIRHVLLWLTSQITGLILSWPVLQPPISRSCLMVESLFLSFPLTASAKVIHSPSIFLSFTWNINIEVSLGNWSSIKTSRDGPFFSHLFFR